jgi:hypothetical protein
MENMPWVSERAPEGWKNSHPNDVSPVSDERTSFPEDEVEVDILAYKRAWARLLSKVYEIDPLACPKCGAEMKPAVIAVIENPDEIKRILRHLVKIGRPPPGFDPDRLN